MDTDLQTYIGILADAKALLVSRPYQTRFVAALDTGRMEPYYDSKRVQQWRPRWVACRPDLRDYPDAMLSLRGAVIAACGSGPLSWRVFDIMTDRGYDVRNEPADKAAAIQLLAMCIRSMQLSAARRPLSIEPALA